MKRKLVKCASRAYSELIRSDIPGSSGTRPARLHFLRSSPLSVMKRPVPKSSSPSISEPLTVKLTQGELRSRLEVLAKKKRSVKWKPPSSPEGCLMSLKVIYFQSIFLIDFYIRRLIYRQEYGITSPNLLCSRKFKRKQKLQ